MVGDGARSAGPPRFIEYRAPYARSGIHVEILERKKNILYVQTRFPAGHLYCRRLY